MKECEIGRSIRQESADFLPASLDGRVACYTAWGRAPASAGKGRRRDKPAARAAAEARNEHDDSPPRTNASLS